MLIGENLVLRDLCLNLARQLACSYLFHFLSYYSLRGMCSSAEKTKCCSSEHASLESRQGVTTNNRSRYHHQRGSKVRLICLEACQPSSYL